ncbi:hypothetical protein N7523_009577 [Penicillium sp. IBT 18751x]|nr:hypothetical protein N7523_009577 [Penicillium sp. IBT 18751x]
MYASNAIVSIEMRGPGGLCGVHLDCNGQVALLISHLQDEESRALIHSVTPISWMFVISGEEEKSSDGPASGPLDQGALRDVRELRQIARIHNDAPRLLRHALKAGLCLG